MHSLPFLRSLTKEASRDACPAAPKQPCLAILRNLARIVVAYNDHLREESYNHYIWQGRGIAGGFSPIAALDRRSHKPLHQQIYEAFCAAIVKRNLTSGQRVPSSRSLAIELKTSRIPILTTYVRANSKPGPVTGVVRGQGVVRGHNTWSS